MATFSGWLGFSGALLVLYLAIRLPWLNRRFQGLRPQLAVHRWVALGTGGLILWHLFQVLGDFWGAWELLFTLSDWAILTGWLAIGSYFVVLMAAFLLPKTRFRRWRGWHRLALLSIPLMFGHVFLFYQPAAGFEQVVFGLLVGVGGCGLLLAPMWLVARWGQHSYRVVQRRQIRPDVMELSLKPETNEQGLTLVAGEFVYVRFCGPEFSNGWHPLTVLPRREPTELDLLIKRRGRDTNRVDQVNEVKIYGPFSLPLWQEEGSHLWLAVGIGLTVFLAGVRSLDQAGHRRVHLIYGESSTDQFMAIPTLAQAAEQFSGFQYETCLDGGYGVLAILQQRPTLAKEFATIRVCGHPDFQQVVRRELLSQGVSRRHIILEGL
jgi:predicted ferric reductase